MRIIGCGNHERGDDAAGVLLVERLRRMGIQAEIQTGEAFALIDAWSGADDVLVIDTMMTGAPVGTIQLYDTNLPWNEPRHRSTHGLGVRAAVAFAQATDRLPRQLRVYGIEGRRFDVGARMSHEVEQAVETLAQWIASETAPARKSPGESLRR